MEFISKIEELKPKTKTAITLGKFDGVHVGHQKLIQNVIEKKKEDFQAILFTFDKPIGAFLQGFDMNLLLTNEERRSVLKKYPLDFVLQCEFTEEFAHMSAEKFVEEILVKQLKVGYITVGYDCTFGYKAKGNYKLLEELSHQYGYEVEVVEKVTFQGDEISSTRIRNSIEKGNLEEANQMLGYSYPIVGTVIHGKKLGRTLGMPTTNLVPPNEKLLPPYGVYASKTVIGEESYYSITNIGCKPTVSANEIRGVETYIFDFEDDLYGKTIEIDLIRYERPELKFDSIEELKQTMDQDIVKAKAYFNINQ